MTKKNSFLLKYHQIILVVLMFIYIIFAIILLLSLIGNNFIDVDWCDYNSCSQEIYKWNYNGSACFNYSNQECKDFLRLWDVCQDYKNKLGVC